jgi:hypothetical protein
MTRGLARWAGLAAVAAGMLAALSLDGSPSPAQEPKKDPLVPTSPDEAVTGFAGCRRCHNYSSHADAAKDPYAQDYKSNEFVLLSEGTTWKQQDPHSNAFKVLESPLGKQMSGILKATGKAEYKDGVTKAAQCLTCHAIDITPAAPLAEKKFDVEDGVTCNACHGIRSPWQNKHFAEGRVAGKKGMPWRILEPAEKEKSGLRNLRDPVVRAQLCASCHVGSAADGRVVTHEMYAAGHPPLPPFEHGTFMECQPKHWGYPVNPDLKFFNPETFAAFAGDDFLKAHPNWSWELYRFHQAKDEVYMARQIAAGAIAALQAEMRMIAADAKRAADQHDLVDYARFDCYACHHDLKSPSDRQARGYDGPPGRPPLKAWTAALAGVVVDHASGLPGMAEVSGQFQEKWDAVRKAAMSRPYGNPEELVKAAGAMNEWCDAFLKKSENGGKPLYTDAEARRLLGMVAAAATSPKWTADPEAAMHLTWAYVTLRNQSGDKIPEDKLKALGQAVPVQVRFPPYSDDKKEPRPAGDEIGPRLELFGKFRSKDFTTKFRDISGGK